MVDAGQDWQRFQTYLCRLPELGLALDASRMRLDERYLHRMAGPLSAALAAMDALERGAIANPDENRMVGHYWLRDPARAPTPEIAAAIRQTIDQVKTLAADVHSGAIRPPSRPRFRRVLSIGIGGSSLGPMFLADALGSSTRDNMAIDFIDNTDPDGIARVLESLAGRLDETLTVVVSKSGGTPETRNGMRLVAKAYRAAGLAFPQHALAITMAGSALDQLAANERWLARFPMFDWIGGRTSVLSAVGLVPASLQGLDIDGLLAGAAACDAATRQTDLFRNPAALMALAWYQATGGTGQRDMVVIPYKDRLLLLGRYLQQLVMESLGKEFDLQGRRVNQGLTVYGNKGSTDQHAYVQQLRDGVPNFFAVLVRVLEAGGDSSDVEPGVTAGDYLHGFWLGTRAALWDNGRESMTVTLARVDAVRVGALIALFERAVGLYANLIGVNAYNQPGVEAGKQAAAAALTLQARVLAALTTTPQTAVQIAQAIASPADTETVFLLLEHLAANGRAAAINAGDSRSATFRRS